MHHTKIFSATPYGVDARLVEIEIDISNQQPLHFFFVGLPDASIRESRRRIETSLKNSGFLLPNQKITINLAPADLKKEGTLFDLPIAIGLLQALKIIELSNKFIQDTLFIGELSLDGAIRPIKGALPIAFDAKKLQKTRLIVPFENINECALVEGIEVYGVSSLTQLIEFLRRPSLLVPAQRINLHKNIKHTLDFKDVKGQHQAKRALQIAAAGRHNIIFVGPPGSGKTMLAQRLPTIMPEMTFDEIVNTSKIYSISNKQSSALVLERPFRSPHHTTSQAGLIGGGSNPQPGEISLAHNGILFLDELTEFQQNTLESLRQPLEEKMVTISRAQQTLIFPASFLLVAALNPCPCGYLGDKTHECKCSITSINKYLEKLSGPLLDRIDLQTVLQAVDYDTMKNESMNSTSSEELRNQVNIAVNIQNKRYKGKTWNSSLNVNEIDQFCIPTPEAEQLLKVAFVRFKLTMRSYHKILKISRTIADLDASELIHESHVKEALMYRSLDKTLERYRQ